MTTAHPSTGAARRLRPVLFALVAALAAAATPVAHAASATGLLNGNTLFDFNTASPAAVNQRAITGVTGNLTSIDYRPATGQLYGLSDNGGLYTFNLSTGVATLASTLSVALSGTSFDISFNPTVDRLRIVSNNGQNLRVDVTSGLTTTDGLLNRAGTTATGIVAAAYTNQFAGATATTLYDLDSTGLGSLNIQTPPNNGTLTTVGATNSPGLVSFDIDGSTGLAYVADGLSFGTIDLTTGTPATTGLFGVAGVTDFAVVPEPSTWALLALGAVALGMALRHRARVA